jgi:hypothetical protein
MVRSSLYLDFPSPGMLTHHALAVINYEPIVRSIPEERSHQLHHGGSLKTYAAFIYLFMFLYLLIY